MSVADLEKDKVYIGFTASDGLVSRLIRWFTKGDVSHVFLLYWSPVWDSWVEHGAVGRGFIATKAPGGSVKHLKSLYYVGDLTPGMAACSDFLGAPYDYRGLLGMTWVEFAKHRLKKQAKNPLEADHAMFCSEIVRRIIRESPNVMLPGLLGVDAATDPEMIESAIQEAYNINLAALVHMRGDEAVA